MRLIYAAAAIVAKLRTLNKRIHFSPRQALIVPWFELFANIGQPTIVS